MPNANWKNLLKAAVSDMKGRAAKRPGKPRLEELEGRWVPSTLDLTAHGAIGPINDAIFRQFDAQPTGTGVIDSFLRVQSIKQEVQQGYNTDHRSLQFDENKSPQFTRSVLLTALPVVDMGGIKYRELLLDINQKASQPLLSVDELRIYMGNAPDLSGYDTCSKQLAGHAPVYDLDAGGDNWIKLDARLNQGSGKGDMLAYIPDACFTGGSYVYLYSKFGVNYSPNAGFEEWAAGKGSLTDDAGTISGHVLDTSGAGIGDAIVFLDANNNGMLDGNEVFVITDCAGSYSFSFLATGLGTYSTYNVTAITPADYTPTGATSSSVSLQISGQQVFGVDFLFSFNNSGSGGSGSGSGDSGSGDYVPPAA